MIQQSPSEERAREVLSRHLGMGTQWLNGHVQLEASAVVAAMIEFASQASQPAEAEGVTAPEKMWCIARFMGEQTERENIVAWLKLVGDSKPHGTDWRAYYEIAEAIEEGRHEGAAAATSAQGVSADDVVSRDSERALLSGHDGNLGKDDRGSDRGLARKEPLCDTCNDTGAIGSPPDDYQSCPDCNSDDSNPTDGTDPASALATPPAPNDDLRAENERLRARLSALATAAYDYAGNYLLDERDDPELCGMFPNQHERIVRLFDTIADADAVLALKENRRG